jgi:hypothetical protein
LFTNPKIRIITQLFGYSSTKLIALIRNLFKNKAISARQRPVIFGTTTARPRSHPVFSRIRQTPKGCFKTIASTKLK